MLRAFSQRADLDHTFPFIYVLQKLNITLRNNAVTTFGADNCVYLIQGSYFVNLSAIASCCSFVNQSQFAKNFYLLCPFQAHLACGTSFVDTVNFFPLFPLICLGFTVKHNLCGFNPKSVQKSRLSSEELIYVNDY